MNTYAIVFLGINTTLLLFLQRRWALVPLLIGACYITRGQIIEIGPLHFSVIRILIFAGMVRTILRGESLVGRLNGLDWLMLAWSLWMLLSSSFHKDTSAAFITRLGIVYDSCGIYFLIRVFCQSLDDVEGLCRFTTILLLPVALEMIYEQVMVTNLFSILGDGFVTPAIREGHIRARGPFSHPILAGTIGAVCLPFAIALWRQHRKEAVIGFAACLAMVYASGSSGPILSSMAAVGAIFMWHYRHRTRLFLWLAVIGYIGLDIVMNDPAYYIIAHIDLTGSSASWHRARLIESAIEHLNEWWMVGTDYTRHWMPSGVSWSPNHSDITNHYLQLGIIGGLPSMIMFIAILVKGFSFVGQMLRHASDLPTEYCFMVWALGSSLFAHATTFISVSYFDQSFVFLYLTLAAIGSVRSIIENAHVSAVSDNLYDRKAFS